MQNRFVPMLLIWLLGSCAPSRFVKPLAKNQQAINLAAGGPLIDYNNLTVPIPFITATYGYGFDSTLTGFASINLTSALYGNLQTELGVVKSVFHQKHLAPGISVTPVANIIYRPGVAFQLYPEVDINTYWDFNHYRNFLYLGISNWFELSGKKASGVKQNNHWLPSPMLGQTFVRTKWDFSVEVKMISPGLQNNYNTVDYKTPLGTHGAFGLYFSYTRKFL